MTLHAIDDPTAFVEHESAYRATREGAGTDRPPRAGLHAESEHSSLSNSGYAAAMDALATWVGTGEKPTPAGVAAACPAFDATYGTGCFLDPAFTPASYATGRAATRRPPVAGDDAPLRSAPGRASPASGSSRDPVTAVTPAPTMCRC